MLRYVISAWQVTAEIADSDASIWYFSWYSTNIQELAEIFSSLTAHAILCLPWCISKQIFSLHTLYTNLDACPWQSVYSTLDVLYEYACSVLYVNLSTIDWRWSSSKTTCVGDVTRDKQNLSRKNACAKRVSLENVSVLMLTRYCQRAVFFPK